MSGLKNTAKRLWNLGTPGGVKGYQTKAESDAKKKAKIKAGKNAQFKNAQMPDEEEIQRSERRKAAARRGSRASTVLTSGDTLG